VTHRTVTPTLLPNGEVTRKPRADDGVRTRDPQLGKLMLYQLSYVRAALILAPAGTPLRRR
jgi:hypothetical protein